MAEPAVVLRDIHVSLGRGAARVHILKGIDLAIGKGEAVGITGHSGSGKSTLLMVLAGLERAQSGSVVVDGQPLEALGEDAAGALPRPAHRHRFPVLSSDSHDDGARERRHPARTRRPRRRFRDRTSRTRGGRARRPPRPLSSAAFGRRTAARGTGPRPRARSRHPRGRRADRQSRRRHRAVDRRSDLRHARGAAGHAGAGHPRCRPRSAL